jgi:hypothetical protein
MMNEELPLSANFLPHTVLRLTFFALKVQLLGPKQLSMTQKLIIRISKLPLITEHIPLSPELTDTRDQTLYCTILKIFAFGECPKLQPLNQYAPLTIS